MTFDEAIEELRLAIPEKFYSPTMHDIAVMLEVQTKVINLLREEYAPTVEMTKRQYHSFKLWKYHTVGWNMTNCAEWARDEKMTATNAMQAWLHPDSIKIVDKEEESVNGTNI